MKFKRIFIYSLVVLLFSTASVSAACDMSCAFASLTSNCHSTQMENHSSNPSEMNMEGMDMPGISLQEMGTSESEQKVSANSRAMAAHRSIGEMSLCEKRLCDGDSSALNVASRNFDSQFHVTLTITGIPRVSKSLELLHDARDGISKIKTHVASPKRLSLRI